MGVDDFIQAERLAVDLGQQTAFLDTLDDIAFGFGKKLRIVDDLVQQITAQRQRLGQHWQQWIEGCFLRLGRRN